MDLNELIILKRTKLAELNQIVQTGEVEARELTIDEDATFKAIESQIKDINAQISAKENKTQITINKERRMTKFNELIVRNNGTIENFSARAIQLASGLNDIQVNGDLAVVGYEPFYKQLGVQILPNLTTSVKLPLVTAMVAGKAAEGARSDNGNAVSTVLLNSSRYTVTETIGKELMAVGNEAALQAFLFEMVKAADRAVTKDIFDVIIAGASAQAGLTGYTTANMDTLLANVDGDATVLFPRTEFYKAKAVKIDAGSGLFLANKTSQFGGNLWDGTPFFYSQLFGTGTTIAAADMKHITVGEFGDEYEVIFDNYSKAPEGQVVVTVCKLAGVVLRNTAAAKKATIA